MTYTHNKEYFRELSLESAYWAGFIAADGYIGYSNGTTSLQFHLHGMDKDHLHRFKESINYTGVVETTKAGTVKLRISQAESISKDLERLYNITTKKSLTLEHPNIWHDEYAAAFIVGYIDGDGWISESWEKPSPSSRSKVERFIVYRLGVVGTFSMLDWVKQHWDSYSYPNGRNIRKRGNYYQYEITSLQAMTVTTQLRDMPVPKLTRKWEKAFRYTHNQPTFITAG